MTEGHCLPVLKNKSEQEQATKGDIRPSNAVKLWLATKHVSKNSRVTLGMLAAL